MAVPSAIQKQRETLKAQELASKAADQTTNTVVEDPDNVPNSTPEPVTGDDATELSTYAEQLENLNDRLTNANTPEEVSQARQEIAALKDKYSSLSGRLQVESKRANTAETRLSLQDDNVRILEERALNAERSRDEYAERQRESERKVKLAGLEDGDDITDDELNEFDPKDIRMIRGLTKKQLVPVIKTLLAEVDDLKIQVSQLQSVGQTVTEIGKSHHMLAQQAAVASERAFFERSLQPHIPQWNDIVKTSQWKTFLDTPDNDADPSVKKGHILSQYRKSKFVPGIVALFKEFQSRAGQVNGNSLGALATPAKTSADRTPTVKAKIKTSEYARNLNAYTKSKSITKEQWDKFKAAFNQAQQEGRVEDDAGLFNR